MSVKFTCHYIYWYPIFLSLAFLTNSFLSSLEFNATDCICFTLIEVVVKVGGIKRKFLLLHKMLYKFHRVVVLVILNKSKEQTTNSNQLAMNKHGLYKQISSFVLGGNGQNLY